MPLGGGGGPASEPNPVPPSVFGFVDRSASPSDFAHAATANDATAMKMKTCRTGRTYHMEWPESGRACNDPEL